MSVSVEGNSEKISPQPRNTTPDSSTKSVGSPRRASHKVIAAASRAKAMNIVGSRPMRSEIYPNSGRVRPFVKRSRVSANGNAARPNTTVFVMPKSAANVAICDVTIRPEVAIIVIIRNINQKTGVFSTCEGRSSPGADSSPARWEAAAAAAGALRRP